MNKTTILLIMIVLASLVVEAQITSIQNLRNGDKITINTNTGQKIIHVSQTFNGEFSFRMETYVDGQIKDSAPLINLDHFKRETNGEIGNIQRGTTTIPPQLFQNDEIIPVTQVFETARAAHEEARSLLDEATLQEKNALAIAERAHESVMAAKTEQEKQLAEKEEREALAAAQQAHQKVAEKQQELELAISKEIFSKEQALAEEEQEALSAASTAHEKAANALAEANALEAAGKAHEAEIKRDEAARATAEEEQALAEAQQAHEKAAIRTPPAPEPAVPDLTNKGIVLDGTPTITNKPADIITPANLAAKQVKFFETIYSNGEVGQQGFIDEDNNVYDLNGIRFAKFEDSKDTPGKKEIVFYTNDIDPEILESVAIAAAQKAHEDRIEQDIQDALSTANAIHNDAAAAEILKKATAVASLSQEELATLTPDEITNFNADQIKNEAEKRLNQLYLENEAIEAAKQAHEKAANALAEANALDAAGKAHQAETKRQEAARATAEEEQALEEAKQAHDAIRDNTAATQKPTYYHWEGDTLYLKKADGKWYKGTEKDGETTYAEVDNSKAKEIESTVQKNEEIAALKRNKEITDAIKQAIIENTLANAIIPVRPTLQAMQARTQMLTSIETAYDNVKKIYNDQKKYDVVSSDLILTDPATGTITANYAIIFVRNKETNNIEKIAAVSDDPLQQEYARFLASKLENTQLTDKEFDKAEYAAQKEFSAAKGFKVLEGEELKNAEFLGQTIVKSDTKKTNDPEKIEENRKKQTAAEKLAALKNRAAGTAKDEPQILTPPAKKESSSSLWQFLAGKDKKDFEAAMKRLQNEKRVIEAGIKNSDNKINSVSTKIKGLDENIATLEKTPQNSRTDLQNQALAAAKQQKESAQKELENLRKERDNKIAQLAQNEADRAREQFSAETILSNGITIMRDLLKSYEQFAGIAKAGSLFLTEDNWLEWRNDVSQALCDTILLGGKECWVSNVCDQYIDATPEGNSLIARTPAGIAVGAIHLQAEKSLPIDFVNETTNQMQKGFLYKITYTITNPLNKKMTYNLRFTKTNSQYYNAYSPNKELDVGGTDGKTGSATKFEQSSSDYKEVCLVFDPAITTWDGKSTNLFCTQVSQYSGAATSPYTNLPESDGTCDDLIQNQKETSTDCGGPCPACGTTDKPNEFGGF